MTGHGAGPGRRADMQPRRSDAARLARRAVVRLTITALVIIMVAIPENWLPPGTVMAVLAAACLVAAGVLADDARGLRRRTRQAAVMAHWARCPGCEPAPEIRGPHACQGCGRNHFGPCKQQPGISPVSGTPEMIIPLNPRTG